MEKETLLRYKNKKVRIYLSSNKIYTGKILSVSDGCIEIIDKFNLNVTISNNAILQLELLEGGVDGGRTI